MAAALRSKKQGEFGSLASIELLVPTAKQREILRAMAGQGERSIRDVAPRVGRDGKAVHGI